MTARAARIRTESMAVRLSKQPISEGYALWDKGYALGAMRLFIFKAESVPPFQLASCLDAIAHLMMEVHENEDAVENFSTAAEKYDMIQNPILAKLMRAKILEAQDNVKDALGATLAILSEHDENPSVAASKDQKTKTALARCYHYAAELLAARDEIVDALSKAQLAVKLGWDRVHCGHVLLGVLYQTQGNLEAAFAAYQSATASNGNCIAAVEGAIYVLKESERWAEMIPLLDKALAIQPRLNLINEKAMALSNSGNDQEALVILDKYIESPPMEELDPTTVPTSPSILYKAKAAILADSGKFELAAQTLEAALAKFSGEEDVKEMLDQIKKAAVGEE